MNWVEGVGRAFLSGHQKAYEATRGVLGHRLLGVPTLLLYTTGRRSGQRRTSALAYAKDGDRYLVVASNGGSDRPPGWLHNLRADANVEVQVGRRRVGATARAVGPGEPDFERVWDLVNRIPFNRDRYRSYQKKTDRPIPVVALSPS